MVSVVRHCQGLICDKVSRVSNCEMSALVLCMLVLGHPFVVKVQSQVSYYWQLVELWFLYMHSVHLFLFIHKTIFREGLNDFWIFWLIWVGSECGERISCITSEWLNINIFGAKVKSAVYIRKNGKDLEFFFGRLQLLRDWKTRGPPSADRIV